jgi:hypothetical protein
MNAGRKSKPKKNNSANDQGKAREYAAGSRVPKSGIYLYRHTCSRPAQEVVVVRGSRFPRCSECAGHYLLQRAAPAPDEDPDFQRPKTSLRKTS